MKNKMVLMLAALTGLMVLGTPDLAQAQYYGARPAPPPPPPGFIPRHNPYGYKHRPHFYINGELTGLIVLSQQLENVGALSHGAGFGLGLGVRTGRWVSIEGNWTFTAHDEIWTDPNNGITTREIDSHQVQTVTVDMKVHIPTWGRVEPFFQVGGGWAFYGLSGYSPYYDSFDYGYLYVSGPTFSVGGGGEAWFGPHFSMGAKLLYRGMYFGESEFPIRVEDRSDPNKPESYGLTPNSNFISALSVDFFAAVHF